MKRRIALQNMGLAFGGLISLPTWANGWNSSIIKSKSPLLLQEQEQILAEIVETIIPTTDTPGAKPLEVHRFVQKMIKDCYDKTSQETFSKGIDATEELAKKTYGKSFVECDAKQRNELLKSLEKSEIQANKSFLMMTKNLTINGYLNSEYVMTNLTHYEMAPARYHGCVPVK
jgi:Gluconate 2-dehydrogenase subunit 3